MTEKTTKKFNRISGVYFHIFDSGVELSFNDIGHGPEISLNAPGGHGSDEIDYSFRTNKEGLLRLREAVDLALKHKYEEKAGESGNSDNG